MLSARDKKRLIEGSLLSDYENSNYINKEGNIIEAHELSFLGAGENSSVWKYKNNAFKIFFAKCLPWALTIETYERMKCLPLKRTLKAKDVYSEIINQSKYSSLDAYMMDFQRKNNKSLLECPTQSFLENIKLLEEDCQMLSENALTMEDIKPENSILNNDFELYLSDIDMYQVTYNLPESDILYKNKINLNYFFKEYILALLENLEELKLEEYAVAVSKIHEIFETPIAFVAASESFEKLFSKYECPKEYFLSLRQKR